MRREGKKSLSTELRHRVAIQELVKTSDGEGGFSDVWVDRETVWAAISPIRADKRGENRTINVNATHLIKLRGNVEISEGERIRFGARVFETPTVENIQERGVLKIVTCNERRQA